MDAFPSQIGIIKSIHCVANGEKLYIVEYNPLNTYSLYEYQMKSLRKIKLKRCLK